MSKSKQPEPLCLWCKHYYLSLGSPGYSEYTPGSDFSMDCEKSHWRFKEHDSEARYRDCILTALRCPDYKISANILIQIDSAKLKKRSEIV